MRFDVVTLFPQIFSGYQTQSLLAKAIESGLISLQTHNLRDWSTDPKHHKVDDRPFGGGPGMLLMVEPTVLCVEQLQRDFEHPAQVIMLTPQGKRLDQRLVEHLAEGPNRNFILLCGRYEGFDQRVNDILQPMEISVGDYVLNGGEVAAMVFIDALIRLVPGVLGDENSSLHDSFSRANRMLEFPQFTRPREFRGLSVPEVLLSGNHEAIAQWRDEQKLAVTREKRNELLE
jgi:tRNA (guanine37-N1)-methyltransferase